MKKTLSPFLLITLIVIQTMNFSNASVISQYIEDGKKCTQENKDGNAWDIDPETEFLCISSQSYEKRMYNMILHEHFKPIDKKSEEYVQSLEDNKDYYFGPNRQAPFMKGIDKNAKMFSVNGILYNQYYKECNGTNPEGILQETVKALGGTTSIDVSKGFFSESLCMKLANKKLRIRWDTAYDVLELNKQAVRADSKKLYVQKQRSYYNVVVDLFMVNLGYLLRLSQKWASKTKNPY